MLPQIDILWPMRAFFDDEIYGIFQDVANPQPVVNIGPSRLAEERFDDRVEIQHSSLARHNDAFGFGINGGTKGKHVKNEVPHRMSVSVLLVTKVRYKYFNTLQNDAGRKRNRLLPLLVSYNCHICNVPFRDWYKANRSSTLHNVIPYAVVGRESVSAKHKTNTSDRTMTLNK